jgi:hypothetical protein
VNELITLAFMIGALMPLLAFIVSWGVTNAYGHQMKPSLLTAHKFVRGFVLFVAGLNIGTCTGFYMAGAI